MLNFLTISPIFLLISGVIHLPNTKKLLPSFAERPDKLFSAPRITTSPANLLPKHNEPAPKVVPQ